MSKPYLALSLSFAALALAACLLCVTDAWAGHWWRAVLHGAGCLSFVRAAFAYAELCRCEERRELKQLALARRRMRQLEADYQFTEDE